MANDLISVTLQDRYRLDAVLGKGGMGTVYRGHDLKLKRDVAVKVLDRALFEAGERERFIHEAQVIAKLKHPNIVAVHDVGEYGDSPFFVMELVEGGSLHELRPDDLDEIVAICREVCKGLGHAHENGIVHRDLKPENVLIDRDGTPKLVDFGIARSDVSRFTREGHITGTVSYLAPEIAKGEAIDGRTDLYSLGVMLYELTTGQLPFSADDPIAVITKHLHEQVVHPNEINAEIPEGLNNLIVWLLHKEPDDRPSSAEVIIEMLAAPRLEMDVPDTAIQPPLEEIERRPERWRATLPTGRSSFVGRGKEIHELETLIADPDVSIITIVGEPGLGKSRLSVEMGNLLADRFRDGVYFVSLAPLQSAEAVLPEIARTFQLPGIDGSEVEQRISGFLRAKEMLLILDNYEHVLDAAHISGDIVAESPSVKILATSRERLGLTNETVYRLSGLPVEAANGAGKTESGGAVELFLERARRAAPGSPHLEDLAGIERICRLLDGNPLAIEMASAWIHVMPPDAIAQEMESNLDLLSSKMRDVPLRHASIRAAIHYSLELLTDHEREVFERLAVFRGSFDRTAAKTILDADVDVLTTLVDKSLLTAVPGGRFEFHEMIRQYAAELLSGDQEMESAYNKKHAEYYGELVHNHTPSLMGGDQKLASDTIRAEMSNITRMWDWSAENHYYEAIDLALDGIWIFHFVYSYAKTGERLLRSVVESLKPLIPSENADLYQRCLVRWVSLLHRLRRKDEASQTIDEAHHLANLSKNDREIGLCFEMSAALSWPDRDVMQKHLITAEEAFRESGDIWSLARNLCFQADVASEQESSAATVPYYEKALELSRSIKDKLGESISLNGLAWDANWRLGKLDKAKDMRAEALRIREEYGEWASLNMLFGLQWDEFALGNLDQAEKHGLKGLRIARELGDQNYILAFLSTLSHTCRSTEKLNIAEEYGQDAYELAIQTEDAFWGAQASGSLARIAYFTGDTDTAIEWVEQTLKFWDSLDQTGIGYIPVVWWNIGLLALISAERGDFKGARERLAFILGPIVKNQKFHGVAMCARHYGEILFYEGELEQATEFLSFVCAYHGSWYEERKEALKLLDQLQKQISRRKYRKAFNKGKSRKLDDVISEMAKELGLEELVQ